MRIKEPLYGGMFLLGILLVCAAVLAIDSTLVDWSPAQAHNLTNNGSIAYNATINSYIFTGVNLGTYPLSAQTISIGNSFTISAWFNAARNASNYDILGRPGTTGDMIEYNSGNVRCNFNFSTTNFNAQSTGSGVLIGSWHNVVCWTNGTLGMLYVDNVNLANSTVAGSISNDNVAWAIGTGLNGRFFNGSISNVSFYNKALSTAEITNLSQNQPAACSNLSAWYPFQNKTSACPSTCTYSGSGNWNIVGGELCRISANTNLLGNNVTFQGPGTVIITGNVTNFTQAIAKGNATVLMQGGGGLR